MATTIPLTLADGRTKALPDCTVDDLHALKGARQGNPLINDAALDELIDEIERVAGTHVSDLPEQSVTEWQITFGLYFD